MVRNGQGTDGEYGCTRRKWEMWDVVLGRFVVWIELEAENDGELVSPQQGGWGKSAPDWLRAGWS